MKALILAAGFGKRLLPYTEAIPKPLFTIDSKPVIGHTIEKLIKAGCSDIIINTHHLYDQIENYIQAGTYPVKVDTIYEPDILDTGGAVKNIKAFIKNSTFIVINSDILFDIDLSDVIKFHHDNDLLASLVLHKHEKFNTIEIGSNNCIKNFNSSLDPYAFTGIQILSPKILNFMPDKNIFSIIELYETLIKNKHRINAFILKNNYFWEDIGTIETYKRSSMKYLSATIENQNQALINRIKVQKLKGDGSDREWFRITANNKTYIASDHGINTSSNKSNKACQLDSFIDIGNHLYNQGLPVPKIYNHDAFSGIAIVEDLGDTHLESVINSLEHEKEMFNWYKKVCNSIFSFSSNGLKGFKKQWAFETEEYTKEVILERECKYFINAFVNTYLKKNVRFETFLKEFEFIADNSIDSSFTGLMHRDMQSKNIMVKNNSIFFIDFQSARKGPLEYDMASLLIDPYVKLNDKFDGSLKNKILTYFLSMITKINFVEKLSNISPQTPIIVGGAYNNNKINEKLFNDFSMLDNVTIRPIILQDLSKLIVNLLKNKA